MEKEAKNKKNDFEELQVNDMNLIKGGIWVRLEGELVWIEENDNN